MRRRRGAGDGSIDCKGMLRVEEGILGRLREGSCCTCMILGLCEETFEEEMQGGGVGKDG